MREEMMNCYRKYGEFGRDKTISLLDEVNIDQMKVYGQRTRSEVRGLYTFMGRQKHVLTDKKGYNCFY
jgi:hypothetical protein